MTSLNYKHSPGLNDYEDLDFQKTKSLIIKDLSEFKDKDSTTDSIYHSILEKTTLFRQNFIKKPQNILKTFICKGLNFKMLLMPLLSVLPLMSCIIIFYFFSNLLNNSILCFLNGAVTLGSGFFSMLTVPELFITNKNRKNILNSINSLDSITSLFSFPEKIEHIFLNRNILITNYESLKSSTLSFEYFSPEELKSFLELFSKEELIIVQESLKLRFYNNKIHTVLLDDIINLSQQKINENVSHINNKIVYDSFISDYIKEESEQSNKYSFKSIL